MKPLLLYALDHNLSFRLHYEWFSIIRKVNTYCSIVDPDPVGTETFSRNWIRKKDISDPGISGSK
jgi:hypothetical protein